MLPIVFLRDDDVAQDNAFFMELRSFLLQEELPIVYGMIPASMDAVLAQQLLFLQQKKPQLIDIAQHGYQHTNHHSGSLEKYEFGPLRTYQQQHQDIEHGQKLMQKHFLTHHSSIFIPPYNAFDQHTLKALVSLGFQGFSANLSSLTIPEGLWSFPAQVSLNQYDTDGTPLCLSAQEMRIRLQRAFYHHSIIGLLFHHHVIQTQEQMQQMKIFLLGLSKMRQEKSIKVVLLSHLIQAQEQIRKKTL